MYSYEIYNYLKEKNYYLNSEEVQYITNISIHTQICRISYNNEFNYYEMQTKDGYYFKFGCKPYALERNRKDGRKNYI